VSPAAPRPASISVTSDCIPIIVLFNQACAMAPSMPNSVMDASNCLRTRSYCAGRSSFGTLQQYAKHAAPRPGDERFGAYTQAQLAEMDHRFVERMEWAFRTGREQLRRRAIIPHRLASRARRPKAEVSS
jgi:hypothetical protein